MIGAVVMAKVIAFAALWSVGWREAETSFAVSTMRSPETAVAAEGPETPVRKSKEQA